MRRAPRAAALALALPLAAALAPAAVLSLGTEAASADVKRGTPLRSMTTSRKSTARFDFARGVGMVEGDRPDSLWLMIADSTLAPGDSLTLISDEPDPGPDSPPDILTAAVVERLRGAPKTGMSPEPGDVFYRLEAPAGALTCCIFGYAVRAPRREVRVVSGRAEADLDGDGTPERFQSCAGSEGLNVKVWSGEPFRGIERWTRYYSLGYDIEPTCPGDSTTAR